VPHKSQFSYRDHELWVIFIGRLPSVIEWRLMVFSDEDTSISLFRLLHCLAEQKSLPSPAVCCFAD
jgi:hypothetical protein